MVMHKVTIIQCDFFVSSVSQKSQSFGIQKCQSLVRPGEEEIQCLFDKNLLRSF
jgi:hypothetical protein